MRKKLLLALITERVIFVVILFLFFFLQYFDLTEFFFSGDTVDAEGNVITKNEQWGHRN